MAWNRTLESGKRHQAGQQLLQLGWIDTADLWMKTGGDIGLAAHIAENAKRALGKAGFPSAKR